MHGAVNCKLASSWDVTLSVAAMIQLDPPRYPQKPAHGLVVVICTVGACGGSRMLLGHFMRRMCFLD